MRPLLVIILSVSLLGGMKLFLASHSQTVHHRETQIIRDVVASGDYAVEISMTFDAGADEFALEGADSAPSLVVMLNGQEILVRNDRVAASESPLFVSPVEGVIEGKNEFLIQASPLNPTDAQPRCLRVRIFRNEIVIGDATLWPEPGDLAQGVVTVEVGTGP